MNDDGTREDTEMLVMTEVADQGVAKADKDERERDESRPCELVFRTGSVGELVLGHDSQHAQCDEGNDVEDHADFGLALHLVGAVRGGAACAADNAEDQTDSDEELESAEVDGAEDSALRAFVDGIGTGYAVRRNGEMSFEGRLTTARALQESRGVREIIQWSPR